MPTYDRIIAELYDLQQFAIKLGLENIRILCSALDQPQFAFPVIHLAGTNGKGSTAFFIAELLQQSGLDVGLFTSPHLTDFRERIRVNGSYIEKDYIREFWQEMKPLILQRKATFFDTTTALGLAYFRHKKVDVAVIETGLGGRLDSTNIVQAERTVITPVQLDHQKQLGHRLSEIAAEKAGIIKAQATVYSARQETQVLPILKERARIGKEWKYLPDWLDIEIRESHLDGMVFNWTDRRTKRTIAGLRSAQCAPFQVENIALAYLVSSDFLYQVHRSLDEDRLRTVLSKKQWPGRLTTVQREPRVIFDVSHNLQGIERSTEFVLSMLKGKKLFLLMGLVDDKNHEQIVGYLSSRVDRIVVTEPQTHRRLSGEVLAAAFKEKGKSVILIKDLQAAYESCLKEQKADEWLLVMGSHYLIGPLMKKIN